MQDLPEAECDAYTRQLQMTEGLLSLAANVARMSPDLLAEICKGADSLTHRVSKLERLIAKQTTVSQEWKTLQDAHKAADSKKQGAGHLFYTSVSYHNRHEDSALGMRNCCLKHLMSAALEAEAKQYQGFLM